MEWLLTLFAMLSAFTGGLNGVRGDETQVTAAEASTAVQIVAEVVEALVAPASPMIPSGVALTTEVAPLANAPLVASAPLYADRLIE